MKIVGLSAALLLVGATKLEHHHHHHPHSEVLMEMQTKLMSNAALLDEVKDKLATAESELAKKKEPACDAVCQKTCDAKADTMIRELSNPLHNITWNCKNNYDVYTTDYDPHHSWFDKISGDVMDVQRVFNKIQALEKKSMFDNTDTAVLNALKAEMGIPAGEKVGEGNLDIREAIEGAAKTHGDVERSPGFIKAYGLENRQDWSDDQGYGASHRSVNW